MSDEVAPSWRLRTLVSDSLQQARAGLKAFGAWWAGQLWSLPGVSQLLALKDVPNRVTIQLTKGQTGAGSAVEAQLMTLPWQEDVLQDKHLHALANEVQTPIDIMLPSDMGHCVLLKIPGTSKADARRAIPYLLAQAAPIPPNDLARDVKLQRAPQHSGSPAKVHIEARIGLVRHRDLIAISERFKAAGIGVNRMLWPDAAHSEDPLFVFAQDKRASQRLLSPQMGWALLLGLVFLPVMLLLGAGFAAEQSTRNLGSAVQRKAAASATELARVRSAERDSAITDVFKSGVSPANLSAILDHLSAQVPKDAWLDRLSIDRRQIILQGMAPDPNAVAVALREGAALDAIQLTRVSGRSARPGIAAFQITAVLPASGGNNARQ